MDTCIAQYTIHNSYNIGAMAYRMANMFMRYVMLYVMD